MSRYTIEVAPEHADGSSVKFTLNVDSVGVSVVALSIRGVRAKGSFPSELSQFDFQSWMTVAVGAFAEQTTKSNDLGLRTEHPAARATVIEGPIDQGRDSARVTIRKTSAANRPIAVSKPDFGAPSDLGVIYWRLDGAIGKVAKHYGVPTHIARDWIAELRGNGEAVNQFPKQGRLKGQPRR